MSRSISILTASWCAAFLCIFGLASVQAEVIVETDIDHDAEMAAASESAKNATEGEVIIVLYPPRSHLQSPLAFAARQSSVADILFPRITPLSTGEMEFVDGASPHGRSELPLGAAFDLRPEIYQLIDRLDDEGYWMTSVVSEYPFYDQTPNPDRRSVQAREILAEVDLNAVIFVEFAFLLTPELDQLRVVAKVGVYSRKTSRSYPRKRVDIAFEYFSKSQGLVLRPWNTGEKEAIISSIEQTYSNKLDRWPHNQKVYASERRTALQKLDGRDVIFERMAIDEGWSKEVLEFELRQAIDHLSQIMSSTIKDFNIPRARGSGLTTFDYVDWNGREKILKGEIFSRSDGRIVYRDKKGNVYSFPEA